jgi:hypothetical protein
MATSTSPAPRQVLDGVPRVGFYPEMRAVEPSRGPEDIIFPGCMRALMQYLGHLEYDYIHFVGVTGAGWYLNWKDGWHADNQAIYFMVPFDEHLKLFQYAFDSTGYAMDFAPLKGPGALDEAAARQRIVASIQAGVPLLAHGVVGPPETCLITGYDEGGDVLIGWSFFQAEPAWTGSLGFEPNGMFRRRDWYANTWDLFRPGPRQAAPDPGLVHRRSLQWASKVARTIETWDGRTHNGLAAFDAWAAHLLHDDEITPDGAPPPGATCRPYDIHDDAVGSVAEARYYLSEYLVRMAQAELPMRAHLLQAAGHYAQEHDLMWDMWRCVGGNGRSPQHVARFADPAVRRQLIALIHQAKTHDEAAIAHCEAALARSR